MCICMIYLHLENIYIYIYIYIEYDCILKVFSLCVNKSLVPEQHVHFLKLQQC